MLGTAILAKSMVIAELSESGQVGYVEPGKVFTYDGNESAEFIDLNGLRLVHLSDGVFDLSKIKRIKCEFASVGQEFEFVEGDFTLIDYNEFKAVQVSLGNQSAPAVFAHPAGGLYGYAQPGFGYLSYVEFAETVHPIDQKYIPPVDSLTMNGADGKRYKLTVNNGSISVAEVV